jgi:membrane protein implicated in regulation of membrane protease activity
MSDPSFNSVRDAGDMSRLRTANAWYALLAIPIVAMLLVPTYASTAPTLAGVPFFYWYQLAWVPLSVAITYLVYTRTRTRKEPIDPEPPLPPGVTE